MTKPTIIVISLSSSLIMCLFVSVSFNKKLSAVLRDNARTRELLTKLDSQVRSNNSKIDVLKMELPKLMQDQLNPIKSRLHKASGSELPIESSPKPPPPQLLDNSTFRKSKSDSISQLESNASMVPSIPRELMEIKMAMTEKELVELKEEVDFRLSQQKAKIANDLGITASEFDHVSGIADQRVIEMLRSSCEESVLYDKLLELNEEVFKEINPEP